MKKLKQVTIAHKLYASFYIIIAIFIATLMYSLTAFTRINDMRIYNENYIMYRTERILEFHQKLTEYRHFYRITFMSMTWRNNSDDHVFREYEEKARTLHADLLHVGQRFLNNVIQDPVMTQADVDLRIEFISTAMYYAEYILEIFEQNFFYGSARTYTEENRIHDAYAAEYALGELRDLATYMRAVTTKNINDTATNMYAIATSFIILAIIMALILSTGVVRSFDNKIRKIAHNATLIQKGDFDGATTNISQDTDELSTIFMELMSVARLTTQEVALIISEFEKDETIRPINDSFFTGDYLTVIKSVNKLLHIIADQKENNERMAFAVNHMPILTHFSDTDHNFLDCSDEVLRVLKIDNKEEYLKNFFKYLPEFQPNGENSIDYAFRIWANAHKSGHTEYDLTMVDSEGELVHLHTIGVSKVFKGKRIGMSFSRDIREVLKAQKETQEATERLQLMFDSTPLLIEQWNEDLNLVAVNPFCLDLFKYDQENDYISRYQDTFPPYQTNGEPSLPYWNRQLQHALDFGTSPRFSFQLYDEKGNTVYTEVVAVRMQLHGKPHVITYSTDITEIVTTLKTLDSSEKRNQAMLNNTPVATFLIDKDLNIVDCNFTAVSMFDFGDKAKTITRGHYVMGNDPGVIKHLARALDTGFVKFEHSLYKGDGTLMPCEIIFARLSVNNEDTILSYITDLTPVKALLEEQQKTQLAEESNRTKSRFLARMSHEIRTPITAVLGLAEIQLRNKNLAPDIEDTFSTIYHNADVLLQIINDILDLSKIEAGKFNIIDASYNVSSIALDTMQLHLVYLGSKQVKFVINADQNMPSSLLGDQLRIKQILNNILSNSFKYTEEGQVTLNISCEPSEPLIKGEPTNLIIQVVDTGIGMEQEQVNELFSEYKRFNEETDGRYTQGTGLGMSIVNSLVTSMQGSIDVQSELGVGTTVTITIPQVIDSTQVLGKNASDNLHDYETGMLLSTKKIAFTPEKMPYGRVLVVDDVKTNLYVARGLLGFYDIQVETANSGHEAIDKVKAGKTYDIIFMDYMMPSISGIETVKIIRELGYNSPIVALTANALIGQAEEFMRNGFDGFISKPIQTTSLDTMLHKFIKDIHAPHLDSIVTKQTTSSEPKEIMSIENFLNNSEISTKIKKDFLRNQKDTMAEMYEAINSNDLDTAHRLAHTIKSLAGLIHEDYLATTAGAVERKLADNSVPHELIAKLNGIMATVLGSLQTELADDLGTPADATELNKEEATAIFDELEPLLKTSNFAATTLIERLRTVPDTGELVAVIEDFEFSQGLKILVELRERLGV